ncbi:MAG: hypothetical protein EBV84_14215, partial [Betaproteobacteria bacterium]|nr:hypothetical protein [Betaproteobacteria bacterium]
ATFEVNGEAVEDGATVELAPLTSSVDVFIETTDPDATFEVSGAEELTVGENDLVVMVFAADGLTEASYVVTLIVLPNNDASADITVNGISVVDGDALVLVLWLCSRLLVLMLLMVILLRLSLVLLMLRWLLRLLIRMRLLRCLVIRSCCQVLMI